jgi:hypothetical protein
MTRPISVLQLVVAGGLGGVLFPMAAWGHHPILRPQSGGERPWALLWFLGACLFMIVFIVTWAVFSFLERHQRSGAGKRESSRR